MIVPIPHLSRWLHFLTLRLLRNFGLKKNPEALSKEAHIMATNLKLLISAAGFAMLASSPVLAASHVRHPAPAAPSYSSDVVVGPRGQVIGADPDRQIRSELLRDYPAAAGATGR